VESEKGVGTTFSLVLPVNNIGERTGKAAELMGELEKPEEPG
jgi:hypothetical protein